MTGAGWATWLRWWWQRRRIWRLVRGMNPHYAISPRELDFVLRYAQRLGPGATVLELGVCHGRTLAALVAVMQRNWAGMVYGIDHWGLEGSAGDVAAALQERRLTSWQLIERDTKDVGWSQPIDLLLVDAGHDEANVSADVAKYVPWVKAGGYVFFDDYDDPFDALSPHWAVRAYADMACGEWEDLGVVDGRMRGWRKPEGRGE